MALTLDATLLAAQAALEREPLVEIVSSEVTPSIPFAGSQINILPVAPPPNVGYEETDPASGLLSTGEVGVAVAYGARESSGYYAPNVLRVILSTNERKAWLTTDFTVVAGQYDQVYPGVVLPFDSVGNPGGAAVFFTTSTGSYTRNVRYKVLDATGAEQNAGTPFTFTGYLDQDETSDFLTDPLTGDGPHGVRLPDGSYFLAMIKYEEPNWNFYKFTCDSVGEDLGSFSAMSAVSIGGLTATREKNNINVLRLSTGELQIWFDYVEEIDGSGNELRNIYFSESTDGGSTWSSAVKVTNYTTYGQTATHPAPVETAVGSITLGYDEFNGALSAGTPDTGWGLANHNVQNLSYDPVNQMLYVVCEYGGVVRMDVTTWTPDKYWDGVTAPAIPSVHPNSDQDQIKNDQDYVATYYADTMAVYLLKGEANTVTEYIFEDKPEFGLVKNINNWPVYVYKNLIQHLQVDKAAERLYVFGSGGHPTDQHWICGYIDLTDPGPDYDFNIVFDFWFGQAQYQTWGVEDFRVFPDEDLVVVTWNGSWNLEATGGMRIWTLSGGGLYKEYMWNNNPAVPYEGFRDVILRDGKLYAAIDYQALYGEDAKRGVCEVDYENDLFVYHRPTYADIDEYDLNSPILLSDGRILFRSFTAANAIVLWDPDVGTWVQYLASGIPGLPQDRWRAITLDETGGMIYTGSVYDPVRSLSGKVWCFPLEGFLYRGYYILGTESGGSWSWGAKASLVQGYQEHDTNLQYIAGGYYVFWENGIAPGGSLLLWDTDSGEVYEVTDYIMLGQEISLRRSIDGKPNRLEFTVTHGNLFDPTNKASLYSHYLEKGRKITVRWGERIAGVEYWQDAGRFIVCETSLTRGKDKYPSMRVVAEDFRAFFENMEVIASQQYVAAPDAVLELFLVQHAGLLQSDINLATFDGSKTISIQWLDSTVEKAIEQVCRRFGYYPRVTVDDKFSARRISNVNTTDRTYADRDTIVEWSPDDSQSDFTNRVVVTGESDEFVEILHDEEPIKVIAGTVGWWGHKTTIRVYYSGDHTLRYRNPRLEVIESVKNFNFRIGGGNEYISAEDPGETWVDITIEMPNLVTVVIATVAALVALGVQAATEVVAPGWMIVMICTLVAVLINIVASIASYQYQLHGRALAEEKRTVQGTADDLEHQARIGKVVQRKFEEPLCTTAVECRYYAGIELLVAQMQRQRANLTKAAHLGDEEGDTIAFPHPSSGYVTEFFVAELTRKMLIPERPGGKSRGHFLDVIEGWVVA